MKFVSIFAAVTTLIVSTQAHAALGCGFYDEDAPKGSKVTCESFCQGNVIMSEDKEGELGALWDCSEISEQSRCVENVSQQGEWKIVRATCE